MLKGDLPKTDIKLKVKAGPNLRQTLKIQLGYTSLVNIGSTNNQSRDSLQRGRMTHNNSPQTNKIHNHNSISQSVKHFSQFQDSPIIKHQNILSKSKFKESISPQLKQNISNSSLHQKKKHFTSSVSKEEARTKLSYFQETFYRQNEVYPDEVLSAMNKTRSPKKLNPFKIIRNSFDTSMNNTSFKTSLVSSPQLSNIALFPKMVQKNQQFDTKQQVIKQSRSNQQVEINIENTSTQSNLNNSLQQPINFEFVPLVEAMKPPLIKMKIKAQKTLEKETIEQAEQNLKTIQKRRLVYQHQLDKLKQQIFHNTLLAVKPEQLIANYHEMTELKGTVTLLQNQINVMESHQQNLTQKLKKYFSQKEIKKTEQNQKDSSSSLVFKTQSSEDNNNEIIIDNQSDSKLIRRNITKYSQQSNLFKKKLQTVLLSQLNHKVQSRKQSQGTEHSPKKSFKQMPSNMNNEHMLDDMKFYRDKVMSRFNNAHKKPSTLYEQLIIEQEDKKNSVIKNKLNMFLEKMQLERFKLDHGPGATYSRQNSDEAEIQQQLAKDNDSFISSPDKNISVMYDNLDEDRDDDQDDINDLQEAGDDDLASLELNDNFNDGTEERGGQQESQEELLNLSPVWKKELTTQIKFLKRKQFLDLIKERENYLKEKEFNDEEKVQLQFISDCFTSKQIPFPIMYKVQNRVLNLSNYQLQDLQCQSISGFIRHTKDLSAIMLHNNNLKDAGVFHIISGMMYSKSVKLFRCERNQMGKESLEALTHFLSRRPPYNLESLSIIDCKLPKVSLVKFLKQLQNKCYLTELKLVKVNLSIECMTIIADILQNQNKLTSLDISWNEFPQDQFLDFLIQIEQNQTLKALTLSMLPISGLLSYCICDSLCAQIKQSNCLMHLDLSHTFFSNDEILQLGEAMAHSKTLQCIHISGNHISQAYQDKLKGIFKIPISTSQIHRHNQSTIDRDPQVKEEPPEVEHYHQNVKRFKFFSQQDITQPSFRQAQESVHMDVEQYQSKVQQDDNSIQKGQKNKKSKGNFFAMPDDIIILQRQLGHCEIKNSYKWSLDNYCWHCESWQFLIIVYSHKVRLTSAQEYYKMSSRIKPIKSSKNPHMEALQLIQHRKLLEKIEVQPQIFASFNNNKGVEKGTYEDMIELDDFMREIENNRSTHYQFGERFIASDDHEIINVKKRKEGWHKHKGQIEYDRKRMLQCLNDVGRQFNDLSEFKQYLVQMAQKPIEKLTDRDIQYTKYESLNFDSNTQQLAKLKQLTEDLNPIFITNKKQYKHREVDLSKDSGINELEFGLDEDIFFYAKMVPPGYHQISIKTKKKSNQSEYVVNGDFHLNFDMPPRDKEINIMYKKTKKKKIFRYFNKEQSVFSAWREDTPQLLEKVYQNDLKYLKFHRMVKDPIILQECFDILRVNISQVKEVFMSIIAKSSYPHISWLDFTDFCTVSKIPDKFCTIAKIDMAFIATNVELESIVENPDRDLNRYEFYEIVLRLGIEKFKKSGQIQSIPLAFKKILQEHVYKNFDPIMPWQEFRLKHLWTLDVDDIFKLNLANCQKLYQYYFKFSKKYVTMQDMISLICTTGYQLQLTDSLVRLCYAYSKMTVVDENMMQNKYQEMVFVEFLEFIARIANFVNIPPEIQKELLNQLKEKDEIGLSEKIEYVMDILFPLVGVKRKPRNSMSEQYLNESDYEL